jgi:flagellum-specific ATP synthase
MTADLSLARPSGFPPDALSRLQAALAAGEASIDSLAVSGAVSDISQANCRIEGLSAFLRLGDCVTLRSGDATQLGEVVRIEKDFATVKPFAARCEARIGSRATRAPCLTLSPSERWKGRVLDALGAALDGGPPPPPGERAFPLDGEPPPAMRRARVARPLKTGVRVVDLFAPMCAGQRIGVFAGSGVGKSSLLAMLAKSPEFDAVVVALVGERGREVREFLDDTMGPAMANTVAVVSTGDESPMMRRLAPKTAMTIAEYFRDRGESVLLIVDSITRFAHAARDVALAAGELPVARGYTPSVFAELPRLLERAGPGREGSGAITAVFAVLVDGDDHNDPVADATRGILDGHIVLDRSIADRGRYPAVNVTSSISRLAHLVWTPAQRQLVAKLKSLVARYEETSDLRLMGGYVAGSDPVLDKAVSIVPRIYDAMRQTPDDPCSVDAMQELAAVLNGQKAGADDVGKLAD